MLSRSPLCPLALTLTFFVAASAGAAEEPPPRWEAQLGFSWLESSGNTDSQSIGLDATGAYRWEGGWALTGDAKALRAESDGEATADRWSAGARGARDLTERLALSAGLRAESDEIAGLDLRTVASAGTLWKLVSSDRWTVDLATELAYTTEDYLDPAADKDYLGAVIDSKGELTLSPTAKLLHRLALWPNFDDSDDYRVLADVALQADVASFLAVRLGYEWRYDGVPAPGFGTTDRTLTAAVVLTGSGD